MRWECTAMPGSVDRFGTPGRDGAGAGVWRRATAAAIFVALATTAAEARAHHHGSGSAPAQSAPAAPDAARHGAVSRGPVGDTHDVTPLGPAATIDRHDSDADAEHAPPAGHNGRSGRPADGPQETVHHADHGPSHEPTKIAVPTDLNRIDGTMFGNRGRSFRRQAGVLQPKNGPLKVLVPGTIASNGGRATGQRLRREFSNTWMPMGGPGRNAIGIANVNPAGERSADRDAHELRTGPAEGVNSTGAKVDLPKVDTLHPIIHAPVSIGAVINGTGAGANGPRHAMSTPATLGGPARNVAGIGGPAMRPKH